MKGAVHSWKSALAETQAPARIGPVRIAVANSSRRMAGGIETYLSQLLPALRQSGHPTCLISEVDAPIDRMEIETSEQTEVCFSKSGSIAGIRQVRRWAPDLIYAHGLASPALEAELHSVAPVVQYAHNYHGTCISGLKCHTFPAITPCTRAFGATCLALYLPRRCGGLNPATMLRQFWLQSRRLTHLRNCPMVLVASAHMRREYQAHGFDARLLPLPLAPNPRPPTTRRRASTPLSTLRLLFVGRLEVNKGTSVLLEALRILPRQEGKRIELSVAGAGTGLVHLQRSAVELMQARPDIHIEFPGWINDEQRVALLDRSHALVMPSIWPEPFGLAGLEALAQGVPVVAFSMGAIPEWLHEPEGGILCEPTPDKAASLARGLQRLISRLELNAQVTLVTPAPTSVETHIQVLLGLLNEAVTNTCLPRIPNEGATV